MLYGVLLSFDAILAVVLITLILAQRGRGAEVGAAFGSGASSSIFGARGSVTFLTKLVATLAAVFLLNSLVLAYVANRDFTSSVLETSVEEREEIDQEVSSEIDRMTGDSYNDAMTDVETTTPPLMSPEAPN